MINDDEKRLDNPVWFSLLESHQPFAIDYPHVKCYQPGICPFGGIEKTAGIADQMAAYARLCNNFFIVGDKPEFNNEVILHKELICLQMVLEKNIGLTPTEEIVTLNGVHEEALLQLVNLVQPGYFKAKTSLLGDYYGVFKDSKLVAVAGERMKMHSFTEVSAIVTHPNHTGKGYATQLIAHAVNKIMSQNKAPYLHVANNNFSAIRLYEKLGFSTRRDISFWNFLKKG